MKKDYHKLGGWLIVFIIVCLLSAFMVINAYQDLSKQFEVFYMLGGEFATMAFAVQVETFCIVISATLGIMSVCMKKKKLLIACFVFVIIGFIASIMGVFSIPVDLGEDIKELRTEGIYALIKDLIKIGIWYRYFMVSKRVKVYFGEDDKAINVEIRELHEPPLINESLTTLDSPQEDGE
ncbi:MAG: DUF2569 family protein [Longicatena sp.]